VNTSSTENVIERRNTRGALSLSIATYNKLKQHCENEGIAMGPFVEELIRKELAL